MSWKPFSKESKGHNYHKNRRISSLIKLQLYFVIIYLYNEIIIKYTTNSFKRYCTETIFRTSYKQAYIRFYVRTRVMLYAPPLKWRRHNKLGIGPLSDAICQISDKKVFFNVFPM